MMNSSCQSKSGYLIIGAMALSVAGAGFDAFELSVPSLLATVAVLPMLGAGLYYQWRSCKSISQMNQVLGRTAQGDLDARIVLLADAGETRHLSDNLNRTLDLSEAFIKEADAAMQYVNKRKFFRNIRPEGLQGSFIDFSSHINGALNLMGQRDVTLNEFIGYVDHDVKAEAQNVVVSADDMSGKATDIAKCVTSTTEQAEFLAKAAGEASANAQSVAAATEEFTASINEIAGQMSRVANGAEDAVLTVGEAVNVMSSLTKAAEKIGSVVTLISKIAGQTNLLALNATIEAARAGDAGKGFAVVASEVKGLAGQTGKATEEITMQVNSIREVVAEAQAAISAISEKVRAIGESSVAVSAAIEEQRAVTVEISRSIAVVSSATADVANAVNVVTASARESNELTGRVSNGATMLADKAGEMRQQIDTLLQRLAAA